MTNSKKEEEEKKMGVSGSKSDFLMDGFCDKKYETVKGQLFLERENLWLSIMIT